MTADQLRKSILQQAIQGKLVPQDPNDEPASVLLERIREEKARLVKEKKIKKEKSPSIIFRGEDNSHYEKFTLTGEIKCIDDEIPFDLPKGWKWCRLGTIFQTSSGTTPQSNNPLYYKDGDINWIRTTDLNNGILRNAEVKITEQACVDYKLKEVPINAVCIAMYGGAGTIGKHALIQFRTTINQSVCAIHPNIGCSSKFLHLFIQHQRPYWMDFAAGSRKDPNINQIIIQHCLFPLPPLAEQERIVAKIEELMPLVEQYGKAQSELEALNSNIREQLKKSVLQYAIEGKLVPQCEEDGTAEDLLAEIQAEKQRLYAEGKIKKKDLDHSTIFRGEDNKYFEKKDKDIVCIDEEIPFDLPDTWAWVRLEDICEYIQRGKSPKYSPIKKYPVIAQKCNQWSGFSIEKAQFIVPETISNYGEERKLQDRDLLWNSTGLGTLGRIAIYYSKLNPYELAVADSHVTVIRALKKHVSPEYLYAYFSSYTVQSVIEYKSDGSTKQKELATNTVKAYLVPLPPYEEQKCIVNRIDKVFAYLT